MKPTTSTFSLLRFHNIFIVLVLLSLFSCKTASKSASENSSHKYNKLTYGDAFNKLSDKEQLEFKRYFFDANKEKVLGNFENAATLFLQALEVYPESAPSKYELANLYLYHNDLRNALQYSKSATLLDPDNVWYQLLYMDCLRSVKEYSKLIEEYKKLTKKYPKRVDYNYDFANLYLLLNMPASAIEQYDQIEQKKGVTDEISMQKATLYKATRKFDKAIIEINTLIEKFPTEGKYYGVLGELYQLKGESEKAFQAYQKVLELNPEDPYAHLTMADYYRDQRNLEKTFEQIKIAFQSPQLDIDTKVKILLSYYQITETNNEFKPDAYKLCEIVIEKHPEEAKSYSIYGDFLYRDKKLDEAKDQYKKALAIDKSRFAIWEQLLFIESELSDNKLLEEDSKEAMDLFPNQALPYYLNGSANIRLKNFEEAVSVLTQGVGYVFDNDYFRAQFYANIGDAQNQLKNYPESDKAYDMALKINPESSYVLNNYAYYLSLRNDQLEKAARMSSKSNELSPNNSSFQDTYAWVLFKMKNYKDAKEWIEKALVNGGEKSGTIMEHYGDILFHLNDINAAVDCWEKALKLGGTSDSIDKKINEKKWYE